MDLYSDEFMERDARALAMKWPYRFVPRGIEDDIPMKGLRNSNDVYDECNDATSSEEQAS